MCETALDAGMHILTFVPHSTHICQPLDAVCMSRLKAEFAVSVSRYRVETPSPTTVIGTKEALMILASKDLNGVSAWGRAFSVKYVLDCFLFCGFARRGSVISCERGQLDQYFDEEGIQSTGVSFCVSFENRLFNELKSTDVLASTTPDH